ARPARGSRVVPYISSDVHLRRIYNSCCSVGRMKFLIEVFSILVVPFWIAVSHAAESKPNWQAEWERTVQAAKKEGGLNLYLFQGEGELGTMAQQFQKKYPEINVT